MNSAITLIFLLCFVFTIGYGVYFIFCLADKLCKKEKEDFTETKKTKTGWTEITLPNGAKYYVPPGADNSSVTISSSTQTIAEKEDIPSIFFFDGVYRKKNLLTPTEYKFWSVLRGLCGDWLICPKVRMEDLFDINSNMRNSEKLRYRGYIKSRHIDFVLCDKNLRVLAGVELDDDTHNLSNAEYGDRLKNEIFKVSGLPLYRISVSEGHYEEQIKKMIKVINEAKGIEG